MAKLTAKRRDKLKSSSFAEPGKRKYPLDTKNRAKNALSRVSQFGSSAEKSTVRKKVHAKYPSIDASGRKMSAGHKKNRKRVAVKA